MQDLMKGLAASTGQSDDTVEEPFISGTFEYGGRAAAQRKVYLFANKAQDQGSLTDATVQFLGVFKTDKKVALRTHPCTPGGATHGKGSPGRTATHVQDVCSWAKEVKAPGKACVARMQQVPAAGAHGRKL